MIGAVVMAAGRSQRMGEPKMILPWGETTVIGRVVQVLFAAGIGEVKVVTGGARTDVEAALHALPVEIIHNPDYANGEMARTLQVGLNELKDEVKAALVVLGDQPQIEQSVVKTVTSTYEQGRRLIVPSYKMQRGHPWLVERSLWSDLFRLRPPDTLREFLSRHASDIFYVNVDTPSIIQDLDTPEDYYRFQPA